MAGNRRCVRKCPDPFWIVQGKATGTLAIRSLVFCLSCSLRFLGELALEGWGGCKATSVQTVTNSIWWVGGAVEGFKGKGQRQIPLRHPPLRRQLHGPPKNLPMTPLDNTSLDIARTLPHLLGGACSFSVF